MSIKINRRFRKLSTDHPIRGHIYAYQPLFNKRLQIQIQIQIYLNQFHEEQN